MASSCNVLMTTADQCSGLNFETARPRREILEDYSQVLERIYDPVRFCARVERLIARLNWSRQPRPYHPGDAHSAARYPALASGWEGVGFTRAVIPSTDASVSIALGRSGRMHLAEWSTRFDECEKRRAGRGAWA